MPNKVKNNIKYLTIKITNKRLVLRPYKFSDFKLLQKSQKERLPVVGKYDRPIPTPNETEYKKFKKRLLLHREKANNGRQFIFGIFLKRTQTYVGQIDLYTINKDLNWVNLGYHIQNQYFNKGIASEAGRLALNLALDILKFHRVEAVMELDNKASQRVAINIGLKPEGIRRKFFADNGGIDVRVYASNAIDKINKLIPAIHSK